MTKVSSAVSRKPPNIGHEKRFSSACSRTSSMSSTLNSFRRFSIKSNRNSEIDELLFAKPSQMKNNNNAFTKEFFSPPESRYGKTRSYKCLRSPSPIRVVTQDNVRQLRVIHPTTDKASLILNRKHYQRLLNYQDYMKKPKEASKDAMLQSMKRKEEMINLDRLRHQKEGLTDIEKKELEISKNLIKKAWDARLDDDCEVRKINEMIKNAKVQSIRAHQIAEKNLIENEKMEEDSRINKIIEEERLKVIHEQHKKDRKKLENEYLAAISMLEQNFNARNLKLHEKQKEAEENFQINQSVLDLINNENAKEQLRIKKQRKLRAELDETYKKCQERKQMEIIEEKQLNQKVMEIQKAKGEKERLDEELRIQKANLREKEYSKMRQMQEKVQDIQSKRDELLEKRAAEDHQRKWRENELEEMKRQRRIEEELFATRLLQSQAALTNKVVEAKLDEIDFNRNLKVSKMIIEQEKKDMLSKQTKKDRYAAELKNQIVQNYKQRIVDNYRKASEEEAVKKENALQEARINEIKFKKLEELKTLGIDEKFLIPIKNYIENPNFGRHLI